MALVLNEEQGMLRDSAQSFLNDNAPVAHLRKLRDSRSEDGFDRSLWARFAELGFAGVLVPEEHGGAGLGVVEAGVIAEQLGRTLTPSPFLSTAVLSARALVKAGSEAHKAKLLPAIAAAQTVIAFAIDEHSKHRPSAVTTAAVRDGEGWRLNGAKAFVLDGHVAEHLIVVARTSDIGLTLFLVDAKAPGVAVERTVMVDAHNAARITFSGVKLAADAVIGAVDRGADVLEDVLDVGRSVVASLLLGIADESFTRTLGYLKERKQFDRIIGEFQALQHRAAELFTDIELCRALVLRALQAQDGDATKARMLASAAKAQACTTANRAVREAVQMHGGMGMTDEFDMGLFMKRARVAQELLGDATFHADRFATLNAY